MCAVCRFVKTKRTILNDILDKVRTIMETQAELATKLTALGDQLTKVSAEISSEIGTLQDAIAAAGNTTPEVDAALTRLQTLVDSLDALNPDAPSDEPTP